MRWRWILVLSVLLASRVSAEEPSTASPADPPSGPSGLPTLPTLPTLPNGGGWAPPQPAPAALGGSLLDPPDCSAVALPCPDDRSGRPDRLSGNHNFANFINWMSNPLSNIDPRAVTAVYPLFLGEWVSNTPPIPNADFQVYGPAITIALSERFAMGVNQGGYAVAQFDRNPIRRDRLFRLDPLGRFRDVEGTGTRSGFLNIGGFFQYTLVEDVADQFILTGGLRWLAPAGAYEMFQGHGPLELAPYVTLGKEFGKFHVLATTGFLFPAGPGNDNLHAYFANVHIDRQCFGWLYPLVEFNTNFLTKGTSFGLTTHRGFIDLGNFEATGNVVSLAAGANAVLIRERLELGGAYTTVIGSQRDFSANGLIVKMTLRY
jgi:hypothetical protein